MMEKEINEELTRIKSIMGLNETLITEKLTEIDDDVDNIYNTYFKKDIDQINKTGVVTSDMFKEYTMSTSKLTSPTAVEAHKLAPGLIIINTEDPDLPSNLYDYADESIRVGVPKDAIEFVLSHRGSLNKAARAYKADKVFKQNLMQEFTEEKIKGSIHHELVHWINNTLNNGAAEKALNRLYSNQSNKGFDFNADSYERQAQIHNIKQLYNKYKDKWDEMTFEDVIYGSPVLTSVYRGLSPELKANWVKQTKQRMYREGLLGKKMYN